MDEFSKLFMLNLFCILLMTQSTKNRSLRVLGRFYVVAKEKNRKNRKF